jgi:hypothetical protein
MNSKPAPFMDAWLAGLIVLRPSGSADPDLRLIKTFELIELVHTSTSLM